MADIELVIKIPERIYDTIQDDEMISREQLVVLQMHILKGTPLPKGHGRLIDADDIDNHIIGHVDTRSCPTIIEADKAESEDKE